MLGEAVRNGTENLGDEGLVGENILKQGELLFRDKYAKSIDYCMEQLSMLGHVKWFHE